MSRVFRILSGVALASALAAAAVIFYADLRAPRGLVVDVLYVFPVLISLLADHRRMTLALAALFTALVWIGYAFSHDIGIPGWVVVTDRFLSVLAIWITAVLGVEMTVAKQRIRSLGRLLTICAWTKQVRVAGEWIPIERYLTEFVGLRLSHGISKEAAEQILRDEGIESREIH